MRPCIRCALLLVGLLGLLGCSQKGAKLQKSVVPPDRTLFETGEEYLHKSQYIKARLAFQTLINTYPDSDLAADSYLAIGDSYYDEGGTENLLQAEDQFKDFIVFFPTSPKAEDAQLKVIALNMKMMRSPDRDPSYAGKAEEAIKTFLSKFPDSEYAPYVKQYLLDVQDSLAQSDLMVGQFYEDKGNFAGAILRFREIMDRYPSFSSMDETYFHLAKILERTENKDEAAIYYGRIAEGYPFSKRFEEAKERLQVMGKPLPTVDTQLATLNQARLKPSEGFSPLKPIVDFAGALGFTGPPDRYEEVKKAVEAQKTLAAGTEAGAVAQGGGEAGDGILIQTTLKKDASGKTEQTTVLGGNPSNANAQPSDKEEESKKESR
jgi:outer membrane assembly lipoprotein YfiO